MTLPSVDINYVEVFVVAIVSFFVGFIWYMALFGKSYRKEMGFTDKDVAKAKKKGMAMPMILNFIGAFFMVWVLEYLVSALRLETFGGGTALGILVWFGFFAATTLLGSVLWEMRSWKLFSINAAYWLVNLGLCAGILAVW